MSSNFMSTSSAGEGEFAAQGGTIPPPPVCNLSLGTPDGTVEIDFPDSPRRLDAAFEPSAAAAADIGWYAAEEEVLDGKLEADSSEHVTYTDDNVTVVSEPFPTGGTRHEFAIASSERMDIRGARMTELNGLEFHLPLRDEDSRLEGLLITKDSLPCRLRLYDAEDRDFSSYLDAADFVHPIHGFHDKNAGKAYVADEYRVHGDVVHVGGTLGVSDLGTGETDFYNSIDNETLFLPRAVGVGGDLVAIADCGNHRVILADRADMTLRSILQPAFMRFPHAVAISNEGTLLIKAFDKDYMTPLIVHASEDGAVLKKMYSAGKMGWKDISGGLFTGALFVMENGRDSERGIHVVSRTGGLLQKRLSTERTPIAMAVGQMYGDVLAIFDDDTLVGFSPSGKLNGFAYLPGASTGIVCANALRHSFIVATRGERTGSLAEIQCDIDSAELRAVRCRTIDVVPDVVFSTFYASEPVVGAGEVLRKYDVSMENVLWEIELAGDVTQIEEDEINGVLLVSTADNLYVVDSFTGSLYDEYGFTGETKYCRRKQRLYRRVGDTVTRYTLTITRTGDSAVTTSVATNASATFEGAAHIAVQEGTDRLWIATETSLILADLSLNVVEESELWDSISAIAPLNYPTSVYEDTSFDGAYTLKHSESSGKFASVFEGSNRLVTYGEIEDAYATLQAGAAELRGLDIDGVLGEFYLSSDDVLGASHVLRVNEAATAVLHEASAPTSGELMIYDNQEAAVQAAFTIDEAEENDSDQLVGTFTAIREGAVGDPVPRGSSCSMSSGELPFGYVEQNPSTPQKVVAVDAWHLENTGLEGTKLSVDYQYSFADYERGTLRRVPVFSWDFSEDDPADAWVFGFGETAERYAMVPDGFIDMDGLEPGFTVRSAAVFDDRMAVAGEGQVSTYDLMNLSALSNAFIVEDVAVLVGRGDHLWCASASRGQIYRLAVDDLTRFETYEVGDAPRAMVWSPAESKFVLSCDSTLHYVSEEGEIETFYNVEYYAVSDLDVAGDNVVTCMKSYDAVPLSEEYESLSEYNEALASRRRDTVLVLQRNKFPFAYQQEFAANERVEFARAGNGRLFVASRVVNSGLDKSVVVTVVDLETGEMLSTASVDSISASVGAAYLPAMDGLLISTKNGELIFADSEGNIIQETPLEGAASSSSSSSGSPGLPPEEPEKITAMSRAIEFPEKVARILEHGSSSSAALEVHDYVQLLVGTTPGASDLWDSGAVPTEQQAVLYGGGNNLEPGQRYYVSVRAQVEEIWGPYSVSEFIMGHFENYPFQPSSSSSSQSACVIVSAGSYKTLESVDGTCLLVSVEVPETGTIVVNGVGFSVTSSGGYPIWDYGSERAHQFSYVGETLTRSADSVFFTITWEEGSIILRFAAAASSSCSSSSSESESFSSSSSGSASYSPSSSSSGSLSNSSSSSNSSESVSFSPSSSSSESVSFSPSSSSSESVSFSPSSSSSESVSPSSSSTSSESTSFSPSSSSSESRSSSSCSSSSSWEFSEVYSVEFDGSNDVVKLDSNLTLDKDASTIAMWFKAPTSVYQNALMGHTSNGDFIDLDNDTQIGIEAGLFAIIFSLPFDVADGNWHLMVFRRNGNSDNRLYIDNVESPSGARLGGNDCVLNQIGRIGSNYEWQGNIDEIGVWDKALSESERAELYDTECPKNLLEHSAAGNLTNWWRMGDGDAYPVIRDVVGGNDGTMTNMTSGDIVADVPPCYSSSSSGSSSSSLFAGSQYSTEFTPGSDEHVNCGNDSSIRLTDDFTVMASIKTSSAAGYEYIMCKWVQADEGWAMSVLGDTGVFSVITYDASGSGDYKEYESSVTVNDGDWHQVAFTFSGGTLKLYIDGSEDTSVNKIHDPSMSEVRDSGDDLMIGAIHVLGSDYATFDGRIDQATIWARALTESEINEAYNGGCPQTLAGHSRYFYLRGWWGMGDEATYPTIPDYKNSNDGTMVNMSADDFVADTGCY